MASTKKREQGDLFSSKAEAQPRPVPTETVRPAQVQSAAPVAALAEPWSVSDLTRALKGVLEPKFQSVRIRGEVSGFRGANARGHLYFALKDVGAAIDAKIWQTLARTLSFPLKDGLSVIAEGALSIYEPQGRYSLIIQRIEPDGIGARALALEALKQKLLAEQLIGPLRKRKPLPLVPRRIGVVTSVSGAALRDFVEILHRRNPGIDVLVADSRVQGEGAVADIVKAIRWMSTQPVDVLVLTRGGGSVDDLWSFNEEPVARAIAACPHPVMSAIGHEIDVTVSDLVADVRAPTPSAAAELCTPVRLELLSLLQTKRAQLERLLRLRIQNSRLSLSSGFRKVRDPRLLLSSRRETLSVYEERMIELLRQRLALHARSLKQVDSRLQESHPRRQLSENQRTLQAVERRLAELARQLVTNVNAQFHKKASALSLASPRNQLLLARATLDQRALAQRRAAQVLVKQQRALHQRIVHKLDALSPLKVLQRGYAIVTTSGQNVLIESAGAVPVGEELMIRFARAPRLRVKSLGAEALLKQEGAHEQS
jgi:exodeoxyribonuclease VII large subunit